MKNRSMGGAVHYIDGPLNVTLTHHRKENALATQQTRNTLLAARYDFGVLQGNFGYADNRALDNSKSNDVLVGFSAPFGATKLVASYIRHNDKSSLNRDAQQWAIGAFYSCPSAATCTRLWPHQQQERRHLRRRQCDGQWHGQQRLQPGHASYFLIAAHASAGRRMRPAAFLYGNAP
jgi:predicted porin